jgi:hypothetical protein
MLTRDAILTVADLPRQTVEVPEWGGSVSIRAMNGVERGEFEAVAAGTKRDDPLGVARLRTVLVALTLCGPDGERLFTTSDADLALLGAKSGAVLDRIALAAVELSDVQGKAAEGK